ncbi:MAG: hypothetical protein OEP95_15030 [Myxococcales bacterium]|nr:hypothetical protein [Myxococcales bacterium]
MADSAPFDWLCTQLEARTELSLLEARGTVRLALKASGLDAGTVRAEELAVVLERVLPNELTTRGVDDSAGLTGELAGEIRAKSFAGDAAEAPDRVFERLGG